MSRQPAWNLCHFSRSGEDPAGPFTANPQNPVVTGGQLWKQICSGAGKHCSAGTVDEGTPEIVQKDADGYFWVTFHGYDYQAVSSARGVAKTRDFSRAGWVVSGGGVPGDAIFSHLDCDSWNISWAGGHCVGGGEGTMLKSGDYFYHLIEAPDITLGCLGTPGQQNWVLGLSRAKSFVPSPQWAAFKVSPTVVPVVKQGCYIQYHRLFASGPNNIYLEFWTAAGYMQIWKLVPGPGPLPIVAGAPPGEDGELY